MLVRVVTGAVLSLAIIQAAPAAHGATILGDAGRTGTSLGAYGGIVAWSAWSKSAHRWVLVARSEGKTSRVPVLSRRVPFDVDLGPGPRKGVAAVYSRCPSDTGSSAAGGCRLFRYDFASRSEVQLRFLNANGHSDTLPTIWKRSIAFVRRADRPRSLREAYPTIRAAFGNGRLDTLRGGTNGRFERLAPTQYSGGEGPLHLDLRGTRVAYTWDLVPDRCGQEESNVQSLPEHAQELWLDSRSQHRLLARGCSADAESLFNFPQLGSDTIAYVFSARDDGPYTRRYRRLRVASGAIEAERVFNLPLTGRSFAEDGKSVVYVDGRNIVRAG